MTFLSFLGTSFSSWASQFFIQADWIFVLSNMIVWVLHATFILRRGFMRYYRVNYFFLYFNLIWRELLFLLFLDTVKVSIKFSDMQVISFKDQFFYFLSLDHMSVIIFNLIAAFHLIILDNLAVSMLLIGLCGILTKSHRCLRILSV